MRSINLGGQDYPIRATMRTMNEASRKIADLLSQALEQADHQADEDGLDDAGREELRKEKQHEAYRAYLQNAENSLELIADLINTAVDSERVLYGRDIRSDVPHYPLTAEKLVYIASVADLNSQATSESIAEEMAAAMGTDPKKLTAGMVMGILNL